MKKRFRDLCIIESGLLCRIGGVVSKEINQGLSDVEQCNVRTCTTFKCRRGHRVSLSQKSKWGYDNGQ
jgi:hypothetical protein